MVFIRNTFIASALALLFSAADAHPSFNPKFVEPNQQNVQTALRVPHGCGNYSTNAIQASVPDNFPGITPQQLTNWVCFARYNWSSPVTNNIFTTCRLLTLNTLIAPTSPSRPSLGLVEASVLMMLLISLWLSTSPMMI